MARKTWFLPPDFNFLPDGELSLGTIIPHPKHPTRALASLADHPEIISPLVTIITEKNHNHTIGANTALEANFFTNFVKSFAGSGRLETSRHQTRSLGSTDLEVRSFNGKFPDASLRAIQEIDKVKKHVNGSFLGSKRNVYIITGLLVTMHSFRVDDEAESKVSGSVQASGAVNGPSATPVNAGAEACGSRESNRIHHHDTAPGIIYAYRLHAIRPKKGDPDTELFSSKEAFFTGERGEEPEEVEFVEVTPRIVKQDLNEIPLFTQHEVDGDTFVVLHE